MIKESSVSLITRDGDYFYIYVYYFSPKIFTVKLKEQKENLSYILEPDNWSYYEVCECSEEAYQDNKKWDKEHYKIIYERR